MNDIITHQQAVPSTPTDLSTQILRDRERVEQVRDSVAVVHQSYDNHDDKITAIKGALKYFDRFAESELAAIKSNITRAVNQKATVEQITVTAAMLIHAFPNVKDNFDSTIYSQLLIRFLQEWRIGEGVLDMAFRHLLVTHRFMPTIAEVKEAVLAQQQFLADGWDMIEGNLTTRATPSIYCIRSCLQYSLEDAMKTKSLLTY